MIGPSKTTRQSIRFRSAADKESAIKKSIPTPVLVVALVLVVGIVGAVFIKGAGGGPAIGDKNTLPPQMKEAYGMSGGKSPQTSQGQ